MSRLWTPHECEQLRLMHADRLPHKQKAARLGRSEGAVWNKCSREGIRYHNQIRVHIFVEPEIVEVISKLAARAGLSRSGYIRNLCRDNVLKADTDEPPIDDEGSA